MLPTNFIKTDKRQKFFPQILNVTSQMIYLNPSTGNRSKITQEFEWCSGRKNRHDTRNPLLLLVKWTYSHVVLFIISLLDSLESKTLSNIMGYCKIELM